MHKVLISKIIVTLSMVLTRDLHLYLLKVWNKIKSSLHAKTIFHAVTANLQGIN